MWRWTFAVAIALVAACGGNDGPGDPGDKPNPPPGDNDAAFEITRARAWYLIGDDVTTGHDHFDLEITAPDGVQYVDLWIGDAAGVRLVDNGAAHLQSIDIADLAPGDYEVLLAADGADTAFARLTFTRTHPLYLLVSTDWDTADNTETALNLQQLLHDDHAELELTHFVGPYTFTDPTVTAERRAYLADWVRGMRDDYGDEIGLHIHPYCNFVDTTTVACRTEPSTVYPAGDVTGYTIRCNAYTEAEFTTLLQAADDLFDAAGLNKPTSFRAGGWTADLTTLRALAATGYVADTSALNWARLEEWDGNPPDSTLFDWNQENWATIDDTSQPYYPNETDILVAQAPYLPLLEVPDNGIMVDYVDSIEMIDVFEANWSGGALMQPTVVQYGFHPSNFVAVPYWRDIDAALDHTDMFRISKDAGPVVYATLSEMALVWKLPN